MNATGIGKFSWQISVCLALATVAFHLLFGLYYATHGENLPVRVNLHQSGEAFLACYPSWNTAHEGDSSAYNRAATEVLRTGVPRTNTGAIFIHAPLYAYFVAGCYWLGGIRLLPLAIAQALLSGLICLLAGLAARNLTDPNTRFAAIAASALWFVSLRNAMQIGYITPTILLLFFFAVALWAATWRPGPLSFGVFTAAIVAGIYTQAAFFVVAGAAVLWLLFCGWRSHRGLAVACIGCIGLCIVARLLVGMLTVNIGAQTVGDSGSSILWEANNPDYESMGWLDLWGKRPGNSWSAWRESPEEKQRSADYLMQANRNEFKAALLWVRENPAQYAKLCFIRLRAELGPFTGQMSPRHRAICLVYWLLIFPAGLYGTWRLRSDSFAILVGLVLVADAAFASLVIAEWYLRYRMPLELLLTIMAGVGYAVLVARFRNNTPHPSNVSTETMAP